MLGYDVSFAFIHAVKLAQQGSVLEKRVGMTGLTILFSLSQLLTILLFITNIQFLRSGCFYICLCDR